MLPSGLHRLIPGNTAVSPRALETKFVLATAQHSDKSAEDQELMIAAFKELDALAASKGHTVFEANPKLEQSYVALARASADKFWNNFFPRFVAFRTSLWDQETDGSLHAAT